MKRYCPICDDWTMEPENEEKTAWRCKKCGLWCCELFPNIRAYNVALKKEEIERLIAMNSAREED